MDQKAIAQKIAEIEMLLKGLKAMVAGGGEEELEEAPEEMGLDDGAEMEEEPQEDGAKPKKAAIIAMLKKKMG